MSDDLDGFLTTQQVAKRLGVRVETVYAYVSRGMLSRVRTPGGRGSLFDPAEVNALLSRDRRRVESGPRDVQGPIVDTSITLIEDGQLFYRGVDATRLAERGFEATARYVWFEELDDACFTAPAEGLAAARAAVASLPAGADLVSQLQVAAAAAASVDPLRYDTRVEAVAAGAGGLIAVLSQALPRVRRAWPDPRGARDRTAYRLWTRLADRAVDDVLLHGLDLALALLIDHDLAISTVAVRTAASARTNAYAVALTGMAALEGTLHGGASTLAQSLLQDALRSDPRAALVDYLRSGRRVPGFDHSLYPDGDPRARAVLSHLAQHRRAAPVLDAVDALSDAVGLEPTIDMALAAIAALGAMPRGAGEVVFAVARTVGWLAHAMEEYAETPMRFRGRGRYRGRPPRDMVLPGE